MTTSVDERRDDVRARAAARTARGAAGGARRTPCRWRPPRGTSSSACSARAGVAVAAAAPVAARSRAPTALTTRRLLRDRRLELDGSSISSSSRRHLLLLGERGVDARRRARSSSCVPRSTTRPSSRTTIASQRDAAAMRWVTRTHRAPRGLALDRVEDGAPRSSRRPRESGSSRIEDLRLPHERARERDALLLPARELHAALADDGVEAVRAATAPPRAPAPRAPPRGSAPARLGRVGIVEREADVARDGGREEERVLLRVADGRAHRGERQLADVDAVDAHRRRGASAGGARGASRASSCPSRCARRSRATRPARTLKRHVVEHLARRRTRTTRPLDAERRRRRASARGAARRPPRARRRRRRAGARSRRGRAARSLSAKPTAIIGHVMRANALQNAKNAPCEMPPCSGPAQEQRRRRTRRRRGSRCAATAPMIGANEPRRRASARLASQVLAVGRLEARAARAPRARSCGRRARRRGSPAARRSCGPSAAWFSRMRRNMPRETRARDERDERQVDAGTRASACGLTREHDLQRAREREDDVDDVEHAEAEEHADLLQVARRAAHDLAGGHLPVERGAELVELAEELVRGARTRRRARR